MKKTIILILTLLGLIMGLLQSVNRGPSSLSKDLDRTPSSSSDSSGGDYTFRFNTNAFKSNTGVRNSDGQFDVKVSASSKDDARNIAIKKCTEHYSNGKGAAVGEDRWLDIIDICVNPY